MEKKDKYSINIQWISVDDYLPDETKIVLATNGDIIDFAFLENHEWIGLKKVTHWVSVPSVLQK